MSEKKTRGKRIGIFGTYGFENMGDAAVADATIAGLKRHIPSSEIVGICQQPEYVSLRHNIEAYSIFREFLTESDYVWSETDAANLKHEVASSMKSKMISFVKSSKPLYGIAKFAQGFFEFFPLLVKEIKYSFTIFNIVRNLDLIVMSGSGQLNEEWGGPWKYPFGLFRWCLLARLSGCKLAFLSVGAGELPSFLARLFCSSALRLAHYRSVRDVRTKELVESWRVGTVHLVPDMAFSMKFNTDAQPQKNSESFVVGINPIPYYDPRTWNVADQGKYNEYVEKFSNFCDFILLEGHSLMFIPNDLVMDGLTIDDIIDNLDQRFTNNSRIVRPKISTYAEVFQSFSKCDFTICTRFHGLLFSFMCKKPVVAIAHHYKFFKLADEMGQKKYCLDIADFKVEELKILFKDLIQNEKIISETIKRNSDNYSALVEKQYSEMKNYI